MKELVILSGKGGTGKTSMTASLASMAENAVLCDADVDAADLHLLMAPDILKTTDFTAGNEAVIDPLRCSECGICQDMCRFDAIREDQEGRFVVDAIACEGCGVCVDFCPEQAIDFPEKTCGQWFISDTRFGPMVHARLGIAEENSGRLVALVREETRKLANAQGLTTILTDGPPGIGCPVIASIGQANAILIVTEPTVSGLHDMERLGKLADHFKIPAMVCINKYDLNPDKTIAIETIAQEHDMEVVGKIPFDPSFTLAMVQGKSVMEAFPESPTAKSIAQIWKRVMESEAMTTEKLASGPV